MVSDPHWSAAATTAAAEEEEGASGLERRQRTKSGGWDNVARPPPPAGEASGGEGDERTVYFDGSQVAGAYSVDDISVMKANLVDDENKPLANETAGSETQKMDNQYKHHSNGGVPNGKLARLESGSSSTLSSEGDEITGDIEIKENIQVKLLRKSKLEGQEIDLERVLEEQETHDLYCPNCNSCITKRVILRKRKRTLPEVQRDAPPAKLHQVRHDRTASAEATELDHNREPDIFRCLSCFSFFISTGTGFNIFRFFSKREGTENLDPSQNLPSKNGVSNSSILKPVKSTAKRSETVSLLPKDSTSSVGGQDEDAAFTYKHSTTTTSISGVISHDGLPNTAAPSEQLVGESSTNIWTSPTKNSSKDVNIAESQITTRVNDEGPLGSHNTHSVDTSVDEKQGSLFTTALEAAKLDTIPCEAFPNGGKQVEVLTKDGVQNSPFKTKNEGVKHGQSQTTTGNDTDTTPWEEFINGGMHINGSSTNDTHSFLMETKAGDSKFWQNQTTTGVSLLPKDSSSSVGGQDDDATFIYKNSTTTTSISGVISHDGQSNVGQRLDNILLQNGGEGFILPVSTNDSIFSEEASQIGQHVHGSVPPQPTLVSTPDETLINVGVQLPQESARSDWDVLKSIVYGGLIESITSLGVVSSAAGSDASTLNIVALGLANLIGGLFVIAHDLFELIADPEQETDSNGERVGRYWELLGRKANFRLHATVAVLTYIFVGLLPPIIYGFSFQKSDNKEYKLIAVAAASLLCIALLAIGKAHARTRRGYIKSLAYYLPLGVSVSGISYVAGVMINRLLEQLGLFNSDTAAQAPPSIMYGEDMNSILEGWATS